MLQNVTKFKTGGKDRWWMLPSFAGMALLLLLFAMLCPSNVQLVHAEGDSNATTFSGWLSSSVTLSISDKVEGNIEPTVSGAFKNISTVANVMVTNSDYYDISIKGSPNMTGQANAEEKIKAINTDQKAADFATNTWGYSVTKNASGNNGAAPTTADTVYKPMTDTNVAVVPKQELGTNLSANDYYTLNFGAKVDTSLPADTYTSEVVLSVVASPKQVYGFDRTDTMQGMTADICKEIGTGNSNNPKFDESQYAATDSLGNTYYTKRLKDTRDNKYYWVAKLKDGNCWMTQNLALDITEAGLTPELSDVAEPWNSQSEYPPVASEPSANKDSLNKLPTSTASWSQGQYVINDPVGMKSCGIQKSSIAECGDSFTNVNSLTASDDPNFYAKHDVVIADNEYDAHYLVGNLYSWNAATAGSGGVMVGELASDNHKVVDNRAASSICPRHWQLPAFADGSSASFDAFLTINEIASDLPKIVKFPLSFVTGGYIETNGDLLSYAGGFGYYWSATPHLNGSEYAYGFVFSPKGYDHTGANKRSSGFSVRCLLNTTE